MKMFIDDQWVESSDKVWMDIRNPGTGEVLDKVPRGTLEDATRMVAAAQKGKLNMRRLTAQQRYEILNRIALAIEANGEELGRLLAAENGKPILQTRA
jgi:acyl-CoA reductase-like NAD-dependent aldehyde dehydrogenase